MMLLPRHSSHSRVPSRLTITHQRRIEIVCQLTWPPLRLDGLRGLNRLYLVPAKHLGQPLRRALMGLDLGLSEHLRESRGAFGFLVHARFVMTVPIAVLFAPAGMLAFK